MAENYIAWNGKRYPNPPPDGWYQASDGRWWAPGTGPTDHNAEGSQLEESQPETTPNNEDNNPIEDRGVEQSVSNFANVTVPAVKRDPKRAGTWPMQATEPTTKQPVDLSQQPGRLAPTDRDGSSKAQDKGSTGANVPTLGVALALLLVVAITVGFVIFRDDGPAQTQVSQSSATTTLALSTTTEGSPATKATESSATTETTSPATTATAPVDTVSTSSTTIPRAQIVSQFRAQLSQSGLNSAVLTDDDIVNFGEDFCFIAANSKDRTAFDNEAQTAIDDSGSELDDDELRLIINTAVEASCPEQADRLKITS